MLINYNKEYWQDFKLWAFGGKWVVVLFKRVDLSEGKEKGQDDE